jgi:hypothetical protein
VQWILANYSPSRPGPGLNGKEEGAAIQAAIWHFVDGFQPEQSRTHWCFKEAVYERALEIIAQAGGRCLPVVAGVALDGGGGSAQPGRAVDLTATVVDQQGRSLSGQEVYFTTTFGDLAAPTGASDAQGRVANRILASDPGTARVTAKVGGTFPFAVVDPVSEPNQRAIILGSMPYLDSHSVEIVWDQAAGGASLRRFVASFASGRGVLLVWETEPGAQPQGFNLYHGPDAGGPWTRLNDRPITGRSTDSTRYQYLHAGAGPDTAHYYMLEEVGSSRQAWHGPVSP